MKSQIGLKSRAVSEYPESEISHLRVLPGGEKLPEKVVEQSGCNCVANEPSEPVQRPAGWVEIALVQALERWLRDRNETELRRALARLIAVL